MKVELKHNEWLKLLSEIKHTNDNFSNNFYEIVDKIKQQLEDSDTNHYAIVTESGVNEMEKYGGSFVKALAQAWFKADHINKKKLEITFPYFIEYELQAKKHEAENIK